MAINQAFVDTAHFMGRGSGQAHVFEPTVHVQGIEKMLNGHAQAEHETSPALGDAVHAAKLRQNQMVAARTGDASFPTRNGWECLIQHSPLHKPQPEKRPKL
jgi:nitrous oxidase accessory protein NosD